jgi:hypothetical protein
MRSRTAGAGVSTPQPVARRADRTAAQNRILVNLVKMILPEY